MQLKLDHAQRLNLHALLGAQRGDVATIRVLWQIQDRIALGADEERAIELKRELANAQERTVWNPALALPPTDFEFSDAEVSRIRSALDTWTAYSAGSDRRWLEPLLNGIAQ
ncbi:MAG: hypothetical protein FJW34_11955 [Acidobacteria bacterium]|nr:hypothetical protein [Acidobacteriota bacterium]